MFKSIYSTGAIVKVLMGAYNHYAVVSDRYDNGKPMLGISAFLPRRLHCDAVGRAEPRAGN